MKIKNVLVLVALAGAVLVAMAQGMTQYGYTAQGPQQSAPVRLAYAAMHAGGTVMDKLASGAEAEQGMRLLAGLALMATIVRRCVRRNG